MADDLDLRVTAGILTAERRDILRLERQVKDLQVANTLGEQHRAKARGHLEAARQKLQTAYAPVGKALRELGCDTAEAMRLSLPFLMAQQELVAALDELMPDAAPAKPTGQIINLGARLKIVPPAGEQLPDWIDNPPEPTK